jgi:PAS domain S-box-containing protein
MTARTEKSKATDALSRSEAEYRWLFEAAGIGNAEIRLDTGRFIRANRRYCQLTGYSEAELIGMTFLDITHPDDREWNLEAILPFMEDRTDTFEIEKRYVRKDGAVVWVHLTGTLIRDESGKAVRLLGSAVDITERKVAEDSLRAKTAQLKFALASTGMGMWLNTMPLGKLDWDDRTRELFFVPPGVEATAELFWSRLHPDDREPTRIAVEAAIRDRTLYAIDHRVLNPATGEIRWVRSAGHATYAGDGSPVRFDGVNYDITERKRAEESLRFQLDLTRSITDNATTAIFLMDDTSRCTFMNPAAEQMTGFRFEEVQSGLLHDFIHHSRPDGRPYPIVECPLDRALPEGFEVRDHEDVFIRKTGEFFPVLCNARVIYKDGRTVGTVIEVRDTTKERAAADALRRQTARATRLVESNIIGVIFSNDERITDANDAFLEMIGYSRDDVQAGLVNWRAITPPEFLPADMRALEELRQRGACTPFEKEYVRKDGRRVPILLGAAVIDADKSAFVGFVQDMSRVKQVENELRDADRRKDEFLATLAHELRNPLAPIRNAVQVLKAKGPQDPDLMWSRDVIDRQVGQMARLLDDLLDVSRITRNKLELRRSRVSLAVVIETALETSRPLIDQMRHPLVVSLPPQPVTLDADTTRLAQVFSNLLNNAAKYSDPGSRIWLTAERRGSELFVSVRDTGIGIAGDRLRHVFEMFSQETPALERAQGGLGIGLSLVRGLVELHGGSVEATSEGTGRGSEFIVRLPVAGEPVQPTPASGERKATPVKTSLRILVVDDNQDGAESLSMMLRLMGNEARTAYDGAAAVATAGEFRPDVILLDIGLPKMSGYDVCRQIRQEAWGSQVVIVAQTGWGQAEDRQKAGAAGFDHHFVKPVDMAALTKLLAGLQPLNR